MSEQQLAREQIRAPAGIGRSPVHLGLEPLDGFVAQPEIAISRPAALQRGQLLGVEREIREVANLDRIAQAARDPQLGGLTEVGDVLEPGGEAIGFPVDPDRGEHADLARILSRQQFRHRFPASDLLDLG